MNQRFFFWAVVAWWVGPASLFATGWEIQGRLTSPQTGEIPGRILLSEEAVRLDMPEASTILNLETGEVISLVHAQKVFLKLPDLGAGAAGAIGSAISRDAASGDDRAEPERIEFEPTGRMETIAGFACEEFTIRGIPGISVWFTRQSPIQEGFLDRLLGMAGLRKNVPTMDLAKLPQIPGFPVRAQSTRAGEEFEMTLDAITAKQFSDTDFAPPEGYQPFSMPPEVLEMMKQMRQQIKQQGNP